MLAESIFSANLENLQIAVKFPLTQLKEEIDDKIDWSGKKITSMDIAVLCRFLDANKFIRKLELHNNDIDELGLLRVCRMLETNKTITRLSIGGNRFTTTACLAFSEVLKKNKSIKTLEIRGAGIGDEEKKCFVEIISKSSLKALNISWNNFTNAAVTDFADALKSGSKLQLLNLERNKISDSLKQKLKESGDEVLTI